MIKKALIFAAIAATFSSAAMAQNDYRNGRDGRDSRVERSDRSDRNDRSDRSDRYQRRDRDDRNAQSHRRDNDRRDYGHGRSNDRYEYAPAVRHGYSGGRGAGPRHDMHRGGYLHRDYRGNNYVVSDWRRHRGLHAPQRGYHWVQTGNDYVLVAIATGLIANVLLNN